MVGMASAIAHRLVGSAFSGWKLVRWNESCGSAGKAFGSDEQSLFHSLDGLFSSVPVFLFPWVRGDRPCGDLQPEKRRRGEEHGSAKWGDVFQIAKKYRDKKNPKQNLILTQHFQMGMDGYRHKRNTNVLVIGGSGAGKSRSYAIPNALNCGSCSLVICDPKSEILRKTGGALKANGYEVRVFDLLNPDASFCYNPLAYVRDDKDVLRLIETLIQSTTPPGAQSTDPFWTKSETALLQALVLYLMHEAPPEEQNFAMVMEMLAAAEVREEDEEYESPLDILFARLEMRDRRALP